MFRNLASGRGARIQKKSSSSARKKPFAYHFRPQLETLESRLTLAGNGLLACYYDNIDFTGSTATRTDPQVNFTWGSGAPITGIGAETFTARWEGRVEAVETGSYNFRTIRDTDARMRLWINGQVVIDDWNNLSNTPTTVTSAAINLVAGQQVSIKLEYKDNTNTATMQLQWLRPGQGTYVAIPQSQLYTPAGKGLAATYYDNPTVTNGVVTDFGTPTTMRTDTQIDFNWMSGSPNPTIAANTFAVHWEGEIKPTIGGNYTFRTITNSDDGVRMWINGSLAINNWNHAQTTNYSPVITIGSQPSEAKVSIVLEYYDNTGNANLQLAWGTGGQGGSFSTLSLANFYTLEEEFVDFNTNLVAGSSWINVTQFGANGSDSLDDTTAFQNAFNALTEGQTLYIPAGTYKISSQLTMNGKNGINIVGEDPSRVTIKWTGASGGTMLYMQGVNRSTFGRITWDGSSTAGVIIHNDSSQFGNITGTQHTDEVFKNCGVGIEGGLTPTGGKDSENVIKRCTFTNCTLAGVSVMSYNSLNFNLWNCTFNQCNYGVTNVYGAGTFNVYQSVFNQSTTSDIGIGNLGMFSFRDNYSIGSRRFFEGGVQNECLITMQGNTILDTTLSAISTPSWGPLTLIDNVFRGASGFTGPLVELTANNSQNAVFAIGNTFGVTNPSGYNPIITAAGTIRMVNPNWIVNRTTVNPVAPELPTTAANMRRSIWQIPAGSDTTTIQNTIDSANTNAWYNRAASAFYLANVKPVVHFNTGLYNITSTLTVPAKSDMQILGEQFAWDNSQLCWTGPTGGIMMRVAGPSHVTLSGLLLYGNDSASEELVLDNADQAGGRIFGDQVNVTGKNVEVYTERLDQTVTELRDFYHLENPLTALTGVGLKVVGGPLAQAGTPGTGKVNVYGNAGGGENYAVDVSAGGKLLFTESWLESNNHFANLTDKGTLTVQGGIIAKDPSQPTIDVNGWNGNATFLDMLIYGPSHVSGANPNTKTLFMGNLLQLTAPGPPLPSIDYYANTATATTQGALLNKTRQVTGDGIWIDGALADSGITADAFITSMLAHTRAEHPSKWQPVSFDTTDIRMNRVAIGGATGNDLRITRYLAPNATATATSSFLSTLPILPLPTGGTSRADVTAVVGYEFQYQGTTGDLVTSLGFFNANGSGALLNNHVVTLYSESGPGASSPTATLGSVTVNSGTGTAGQYDYVSLSSPVSLTHGAWYVVGSTVVTGGDPFLDTATITPHPLAANINGRYHIASPTGYPESSGSSNYIGPSMLVTSVTSRAPQNIVNGGEFAGGVQGTDADNNMYLSGANQLTPTITIDLGASYNITGFRQWNYNEIAWGVVDLTSRGIKTVSILTSTDGVNYTSRGTFTFAKATGAGYQGQDDIDASTNGVPGTWTGVRYLKLQVLTNWGDTQFSGLSKIQFRTA